MTQLDAYPMFIDGHDWAGSGSEVIEVVNPFTTTAWATVPVATDDDVDRAVVAARRAREEGPWFDMLPAARAKALRRFAEFLDAAADELTATQVRENGKAIREQSAQTKGLSGFLTYYAGVAETHGGETIPVSARDTLAYTIRQPVGVIACLTPWNSPLALLMWKLAPALAAGNTVVIKPSEITPISTLMLARVARDSGIPDGVINVVTGAGATGAALAQHPGVDRIAFTGSTDVGRLIGKVAGERLIGVSLELGGKSPNIVFADANLSSAIEGVVGGVFAAAGQTCIAGSRVLVHEDIYDEFVDRLVERARRIVVGDPMDWNTEVGTISNVKQFDKIQTCIRRAIDDGATVLTGGGRPEDDALSDGLFILPTIVTNVSDDMAIVQEEIFGPVVSIQKFATDDEAVTLANSTQFGLAAGVWTADVKRAHTMARRLVAGTVWINTYRKTNYATPFGGVKDSGIGRENGRHALDDFTDEKLVWLDLGHGIADPFNPFG